MDIKRGHEDFRLSDYETESRFRPECEDEMINILRSPVKISSLIRRWGNGGEKGKTVLGYAMFILN